MSGTLASMQQSLPIAHLPMLGKHGEAYCPECSGGVEVRQDTCGDCGTALDWLYWEAQLEDASRAEAGRERHGE